ncbi:MAG: hypothetical protein D6714_05835, partial [Bacteroidetes bacterium]
MKNGFIFPPKKNTPSSPPPRPAALVTGLFAAHAYPITFPLATRAIISMYYFLRQFQPLPGCPNYGNGDN